MKTNSVLLPLVVCWGLGGCSAPREQQRRDSPTSYWTAANSATEPRPVRPGEPARTPSPSPEERAVSPSPTDETVRKRQVQLQKRIDELSNEEADEVCLSLELIPREQIFDRGLNPKKLLRRQASEATMPDELSSIERAINNLRR